MNDPSYPLGDRRFPPGSALLLILLITAELTVSSDFSIASIALPSIERGLGLAPAISQWVITGDLLAYAGLLIIAGRLADIYGQRRTLTIGLLTFLTGTVLASLSFNAPMLIGARIMQGIGGAFTYPSAFSLLTISFKEGPQRFRAYTINMAAASAGVPLVTMFVGWAVTHFGWQSAFLFNVPLCIVVLAGIRYLPPEQRERPRIAARLPVVGALLLTSGIAAIVYALTGFVARHSAPSGQGIAILLAGVVILAIFTLTQRRSKTPLVPAGLLNLQNFAAGIVVVGFVVLTGKAMIVLSNISLQRGMELTPFMASLTLWPMVVSSLIVVPISSRLDRLLLPHARSVICGAFAILATFYLVLAHVPAQWAIPVLAVLLFLSPFLTLTNVNLALNTTLQKVSRESQGVATAITYTAVQIITATGMAVVIAASGTKTAGALGGFQLFSTSFLIGGAFCLAGLAIAALGFHKTSN